MMLVLMMMLRGGVRIQGKEVIEDELRSRAVFVIL